jgi:hypothetical protein
MMTLSKREFEQILLDRWSHGKNKDTKSTKGLFSCGKSILQVHGSIHKENVIVSINPSCKQKNFNIQLVNRFQISKKNIQITHFAGENTNFFKDLKLNMDKYVLHSDFEALDEEKLQEGHNQQAKEVIDSKAQSVADLKKKEQIPIVIVYRHPHHIETQQSSRQGRVYQHIYAPVGHQ